MVIVTKTDGTKIRVYTKPGISDGTMYDYCSSKFCDKEVRAISVPIGMDVAVTIRCEDIAEIKLN